MHITQALRGSIVGVRVSRHIGLSASKTLGDGRQIASVSRPTPLPVELISGTCEWCARFSRRKRPAALKLQWWVRLVLSFSKLVPRSPWLGCVLSNSKKPVDGRQWQLARSTNRGK